MPAQPTALTVPGGARRRLRLVRRPWRELRARAERALAALAGYELLPAERRRLDDVAGLARSLAADRSSIRILDYGLERGREEAPPPERDGRAVVRELADHHRRTSVPETYGLLLFRLVRELHPSVALELGTSLGISAAYQAAALELNEQGRLVTLEGAPALAERARANLDRLGLRRVEVRSGRFQDLLEPTLRELGRAGFAFVDGHHDGPATVAYSELMLPRLAEGAVVVFDDIAWSPGMRRAWERIRAHGAVRVAFKLGRMGVCCVDGAGPGPTPR